MFKNATLTDKQTDLQIYTHINSEVISNGQVSQLAQIYVSSSNCIQDKDIGWEAQSASCRKTTKKKTQK